MGNNDVAEGNGCGFCATIILKPKTCFSSVWVGDDLLMLPDEEMPEARPATACAASLAIVALTATRAAVASAASSTIALMA